MKSKEDLQLQVQLQAGWNKYVSEGGNLEDVPIEFRNSDTFLMFIKKGGNLGYVPEKFITKEMCEIYMNNGGILSRVPSKFITKEVCVNYLKNGGNLEYVPEKFLTQEMCSNYIKKGGHIEIIPEKFRTQEICNDYIKNGGFIDNVPYKFITEEMCKNYMKNGGDLSKIPENFLTQEMCEKYLFGKYRVHGIECNIIIRFEKIPSRFKNKELCEKYLQSGGTFNSIPKELVTEEMCENYLNKGGSISRIPSKFRTKEMCEDHIKKGGSINYIPAEYRTQEMWDTWYKKNKEKQIIKDLLLGNLEFNTKKELEEKYNITSQRLNTVLEGIKYMKPEIYEAIKNKFKHNSLKQYYGIEKDIQKVMDIINSLGPKPQRIQRKLSTAYSKEQKIQFSYLLSHAEIQNSIFDLYNHAISGNIKFNCADFIRFCRVDLGLKFADINKSALTDNEQLFLKVGNSWLMGFNEDRYLKDSQGNEIKHVYLDKNGEQVEIKGPELDIILNSLKVNQIPKSNCIVNEAIRKYVQGELDVFINDLKSGEYLKKNTSTKPNNNKKY